MFVLGSALVEPRCSINTGTSTFSTHYFLFPSTEKEGGVNDMSYTNDLSGDVESTVLVVLIEGVSFEEVDIK